MKIALVQRCVSKESKDNIDQGLLALEEAASKGANLVAFPELAFTNFLPQYPFTPDAMQFAEPIPGPTTQLFCQKAKELGVVVVLNLFEKDGSRTYDSSPVIDSTGQIIGKTRMVHIIEAPCFHEKGYYTPGNLGAGVFPTTVGRIGIAICYDRHFPEYMRALALKGAELVIVPQAGALNEWTPGIFEAELQVASFQNGYFTALVNRVGKEETVTFAGGSFVTDPTGRIIAQAPEMIDTILYAEMDFNQLDSSPANQYFMQDRRPNVYGSL